MLSNTTIEQSMQERMRPIRGKESENSLLVHEIYASVQGESSFMGMPCVFVRTTGCHLRCSYCDTEPAFFNGSEMDLEDIIKTVSSLGINLVELTGGEPLLQKASFTLLARLVEMGFSVMLETSGAVSIKNVDRGVKVILDVKTPSSRESKKNVWANLEILWPGCEVKFVIGCEEDYQYAKEICERYDLYKRTHILFSPVVAQIEPTALVEMIMKDRLPVRFQMQLHRILYGETPGR